MAEVIVSVPAEVKSGELVELKALIRHPMETGFRHTQNGERIPRNIITEFSCTYAGEPVFSATLYPSITANPLVSFYVRAAVTAELAFRWRGDNGFDVTERVSLRVT